MKRIHLLWLLAYPLYQVIGTLRHEASHALAAVLQGAEIIEFAFLPTLREGFGLSWGYVRWRGATGWVTLAAPYLCDLLTFAVFFAFCMWALFRWRWLWLNLVILGMISPLINSGYNYAGGFWRANDVGRLLDALPPWGVHAFFILSLAAYLAGIVLVFRRSRSIAAWKQARFTDSSITNDTKKIWRSDD